MGGARTGVVCAVVALVAASGCGGTSHGSTGTATKSTAQAAVPASAPPGLRAIAGRVLVAGDLAGFAPHGRRTLGLSAADWVVAVGFPQAERAREKARLEHDGFISGVREVLTPGAGGPAEAISIVQRFTSPRGAREALANELASGATGGARAFSVPGIPAAGGFGGKFSGSTGYNVAFSNGDYFYLVGTGYPTGTPHPPTQADLVAAAKRLYARVHG